MHRFTRLVNSARGHFPYAVSNHIVLNVTDDIDQCISNPCQSVTAICKDTINGFNCKGKYNINKFCLYFFKLEYL